MKYTKNTLKLSKYTEKINRNIQDLLSKSPKFSNIIEKTPKNK